MRIEQAILNGEITVKEPRDSRLVQSLVATNRLSRADAETVALAKELDATPVLDDSEARKAAEALSLAPITTLHILFFALADGVLTVSRLKETFRRIALDLYLSPEVIAEFYGRVEELEKITSHHENKN